jgi:hypothetical protein
MHMAPNDPPKTKKLVSIFDDPLVKVERSVSAAVLLAARTGQPMPDDYVAGAKKPATQATLRPQRS